MPKYTTLDNLARKLRGRLNLGSSLPEESEINNTLNALFAYTPSAEQQSVDLLLIDQIAEQEEVGFIDLVLSQLYQYPLRLTSDVTVSLLATISECFILSSLLSVHFQGQNPGIIASDISQAAMDWRRYGEYRLYMLTVGENIWFPMSLQAPPSSPGMTQTQALRLPGEILLGQGSRPDLISRNYSSVTKRNINRSSLFFDDEDAQSSYRRGLSGRNDATNSAIGSDPPCTYDIDSNSYPGFERFDF